MPEKIFLPLLALLFLFRMESLGQEEPDYQHISAIVTLDSFVITATRKGFDVGDFIKLIRTDNSFFQAFHNLRFLTYRFDNDIKMYNKKGVLKASLKSTNHQFAEGNCRTMEILEEDITGNYYKKKNKHRYYTAKLYDHLFFTRNRICESRTATLSTAAKSGMAGHIAELKKLIFRPGEKANVPLIGKKTAIFEENMLPYYDLSIQSKKYNDSIDCYVFTAKVRAEFESKKEGKTVIKFLETYIDKSTFQVIARQYHLFHKTMAYDFDVKMNIKLKNLGNQYVPEFIEYNGRWDIPAKKPEISKFRIRFYDFQIP